MPNPLSKYIPEDSLEVGARGSIKPLSKYIPEEKPKEDNLTMQNRFAAGVSNVAKGYLTTFAGMPESIGIAAKQLADNTDWEGQAGKDVSEYEFYQLGQSIRKAAEDLFPTNPAYRDEFITTTLAKGAGSALGFITNHLLTKGLGMSSWMASALLGAGSQGAEEFNVAKEKGQSNDVALKAWSANLPIGALEAVPLERAFNRINKVTGGKMTTWLINGAKGGLEEGVQEAVQGFASNATAKELYDAERGLMDGVAEGGLSGFIIGMALNGMGSAVKSRIVNSREQNTKVDPETEKLLRQWAKTQVDESEWIDWIENTNEMPDKAPFAEDLKHESFGSVLRKNGVDVSGDGVETTYEPPRTIKKWIQKVLYPEYILYKQYEKGKKSRLPMELSVELSNKQLTIFKQDRDMEAWFKSISHGLKETSIPKVREAIDLVYGLRNESMSYMGNAKAKTRLAELYVEDPKIQQVMEGVDHRGGIIELFEHVKMRFQESLRERYFEELDSDQYSIFSLVVDSGMNLDEAIDRVYNIEQLAHDEYIKYYQNKKGTNYATIAESNWLSKDKARQGKIDRVRKRETKKLSSKLKEYYDISKWGVKDFQTRIEMGNYKVVDDNDNTLAWAPTAAEAQKKSAELRQQVYQETGQRPPRWRVKAEVSRIDPSKQRKDVLKGELDIFKSLPAYVHAMEKRIAMYPLVRKFDKLKKKNPEDFTPDVNAILQGQINAVMGNNYSWIEQVVDEYSIAKGWKTGKYKRMVSAVNKTEANLKLGYRPTAAYINGMTGFGMTYVKVGAKFWQKGMTHLAKGSYKAPDGEVIDLRKLIHDLDENSQLGMDFAVQEDGTIRKGQGKLSVLKPLGLFRAPEGPVRRHGFAANYIMQRELFNKTHQEAVWEALQGVRFQQNTYNTAAIPELLRSPTGRLIGQFKAIMINQAQFWTTLKGPKEFIRMLEVQMLLAGPRGIVYFLKSLPILASMGVLDDLEELLLKKDTTLNKTTMGLSGLAGVDLSGPATFQFPGAMEDWLGPALSDLFKLFKEVVIPGAQIIGASLTGQGENAPNYLDENLIDWAKGLAPIMYYWDKVLDSVLIWDSWKDVKDGDLREAARKLQENFQSPDIWIRDSNGDKAALVNGAWDRVMMLSGAKLIDMSYHQVLEKNWNRNMGIRRNNRKNVVNKVIRKLVNKQEITKEDLNDLILYGVDIGSIPNRWEYAEMTPEQRNVLKARLLDKAEALDHFNFNQSGE